MADQYRDSCVKRQNKNRGKQDPIRVSFFDKDGMLIDDITRKEANCIAALNPGQLFYFQDGDGYRRELVIREVNRLKITDALPSNSNSSTTSSTVTSRCPTNPFLCGPPKVRFFGGFGFGAMANSIISPNSSSVIGFDIVNPGFNYLSAPFATLEDECGNGSGGSLVVQTKPVGIGTTNAVGIASTSTGKGGLEIKNIVITAPGDGYIAGPNGSLGGNGRIWVDVGDGYVQKADGTFYPVPGGEEPTDLQPGDTFVPPQPPQVQPEFPSYPVVLEIEEIYVYDPGFGYQPGDTITIENGDYGAVLEPVINDRGEIESVNVIDPGLGFIDTPDLIVNSNTGYNARLIAVLNPIPLEQITSGEIAREIPPTTQIISVIDCVGKIPPKSSFDIVPR
jgi:hypothetical protein